MDEGVSPLAIVQAIDALKRVPGVLLADIEGESGRAIVAHDPGVGSASLLAAGARAGMHLRVVAGSAAPGATSEIALAAVTPARRLLALLTAAALLVAFLGTSNPNLAKYQLILPILLSVWAFIIARAMYGHRP
jgi:hypothetical protein